jgi:hypothetical protein
VSDRGLPFLTPESAAYIGVGTVGFVALALLLVDSGLGAQWILAIGTLYGSCLSWLYCLAEARAAARLGESSSEEVSP